MRLAIAVGLLACSSANAWTDMEAHHKPPPFLYAVPGGFPLDQKRTQFGCGIPPGQDIHWECDYDDEVRQREGEQVDSLQKK